MTEQRRAHAAQIMSSSRASLALILGVLALSACATSSPGAVQPQVTVLDASAPPSRSAATAGAVAEPGDTIVAATSTKSGAIADVRDAPREMVVSAASAETAAMATAEALPPPRITYFGYPARSSVSAGGGAARMTGAARSGHRQQRAMFVGLVILPTPENPD